jgi:hypothetical protein
MDLNSHQACETFAPSSPQNDEEEQIARKTRSQVQGDLTLAIMYYKNYTNAE